MDVYLVQYKSNGVNNDNLKYENGDMVKITLNIKEMKLLCRLNDKIEVEVLRNIKTRKNMCHRLVWHLYGICDSITLRNSYQMNSKFID